MKTEGKKVTFVSLHSPIFVPGLGQIGPTLTDTGDRKTVGIDMVKCDDGVFVKLKGFEFLVPTPNCITIVFAKEVQPVKSTK